MDIPHLAESDFSSTPLPLNFLPRHSITNCFHNIGLLLHFFNRLSTFSLSSEESKNLVLTLVNDMQRMLSKITLLLAYGPVDVFAKESTFEEALFKSLASSTTAAGCVSNSPQSSSASVPISLAESLIDSGCVSTTAASTQTTEAIVVEGSTTVVFCNDKTDDKERDASTDGDDEDANSSESASCDEKDRSSGGDGGDSTDGGHIDQELACDRGNPATNGDVVAHSSGLCLASSSRNDDAVEALDEVTKTASEHESLVSDGELAMVLKEKDAFRDGGKSFETDSENSEPAGGEFGFQSGKGARIKGKGKGKVAKIRVDPSSSSDADSDDEDDEERERKRRRHEKKARKERRSKAKRKKEKRRRIKDDCCSGCDVCGWDSDRLDEEIDDSARRRLKKRRKD